MTVNINSTFVGTAKLAIEVDYYDVLSYAYAGTRRPLVRRIRVANAGGDLAAGTLIWPRVFVESAVEGDLVSKWQGLAMELPDVDEGAADWDQISTPMMLKTVGRLEEPVAAEVVVQIFAGETLVEEQRLPLTVLAANEWMFRAEYLDALAAFVLPNSKAIVPVLQRARELLGERTGSRSTEGYQGGDERVHQLAEAVYDALSEQKIDYSNPPASFAGYGQKIRSPRTILSEKVGTCLDTSVLYAACLAQVGLEPVIFVVQNHAFSGYLASALQVSQDTVVSDKAELVELFAKERVHPVETTTLCTGVNYLNFNAARECDKKYWSHQLAEMQGMVVVRRCWQTGIMPPPVLSDQLTNEVEGEITQSSAQSSAPDGVDGILDEAWEPGLRAGRRPPPRVRSWLASLLDLSRNNRLLDIKIKEDFGAGRSTGRIIEFEIPRGLIGEIDDALFEEGGKIEIASPFKLPGEIRDAGITEVDLKRDFKASHRLFFPPYSSIRNIPADVEAQAQASCIAILNKKLTNMQRQAREVEEQSGSNPLFMALGLLDWTEDQKKWSAPLFLYPVKILGEGRSVRRVVLDESGDVIPNYCLREKFLRPPHGIDLAALELPERDAHGIDLVKMLDVIRAKLKEGGAADTTVSERCFLGVFNYSSFRLWKDIRDHWETFRDTSPVVKHLMMHATGKFEDVAVDDGAGDVVCPIIADDSQIDAVRRAMSGQSFVLEGPPGTGKTQTITNLLASCLAKGKKVLFVAEKRTALDQVKKRLAQVGLSNYCLDLHSSGDTDARIRKNILEQIELALGSDADPRDQKWADLVTRRQQHETDLDEYCSALHDKNAAGFSAWSSREQILELGEGRSAVVTEAFLGQYKAVWPELLRVVTALPSLVHSAGGLAGNPWRFVEQVAFASINREEFGAAVEGWVQAAADFENLPEPWGKLQAVAAPEHLHLFGDWVQLAAAGGIPSAVEFGAIQNPKWHKRALQIFAELVPLVEQFLLLSRSLNPRFYLRADIAVLAQAARDAEATWFFVRKRHRRAVAAAIGSDALETDLSRLCKAVTDAAVLKPVLLEVCSKLSAMDGFSLPSDWNPMLPDALRALEEYAALLVKLAKHRQSEPWPAIMDALNTTGSPEMEVVDVVARAALSWDALAGHIQWTPGSLARWCATVLFGKCWSASAHGIGLDGREGSGVANRFLKLQRWAAVLEALEKISHFGFSALRQEIVAGDVDLKEVENILRRGIAQLAVRERLEAGNLYNFDGSEHDGRVGDYIKAERDARDLLKLRIPGLVRQRNPKSQLSGGRVFGETEELKRRLLQKRDKAPVRKLLEKFGERLAGLMPCFLMSSDSVASFLPPGSVKFDLVVFDEASQIEVARAIGALGRGTASIVVGDSHQMPPTRFGGTAAGANQRGLNDDDEDEEHNASLDGEDDVPAAALMDEESILTECSESGIEPLQLLCHYRSKDESLIAFSNKYIYPQPMLTFPAPGAGKIPALSFRKVEGQFLRLKDRLGKGRADLLRTNPEEAKAVVAEVKRRLKDPVRIARRKADSERVVETIIVVTFNVQQMNLVLELLVENEADESPIRLALMKERNEEKGIQYDPQVKIRNLENVQGDEAETVLFSVAFSKHEPREGKLPSAAVPLHFGPLGNVGGQRRLNVAVTRAQREMIVFCSFFPEDMPVKETTAEGVKLLQKFLTLAKNGVAKNAEISGRGTVSAHVSEIGSAIAGLGFRVGVDIGLSTFKVDIAVGFPDTNLWALGILVDGPGWHSRGTAYQRDVLPPAVLRELGWQKVMRIWLPSWIADSDAILVEVKKVLDQLAAGVVADPVIEETEPVSQTGIDVIAHEHPLEQVSELPGQKVFMPYVVSSLRPRYLLNARPTPVGRRELEQVFGAIISQEAPVEVMRFARLVGNSFGMARVVNVRALEILNLVDKKLRTSSALGEFIWAPGVDPSAWIEFRASGEANGREAHEIPPEEYRNAMVALVNSGGSIGQEEISRLVADIFGFGQIGVKVKRQFDGAIAWACAAGSITLVDGRYCRGA